MPPGGSAPERRVRPSQNPEERRAQFEAVALPLAEVLHAAALRMTRNAARAEDLVQETFVRAWQNFDRFELGTNFKAWLFQIMTFLHRNERRSAKAREATVDFSGNEVLAAPEPPPDGTPSSDAAKVDWNALYPDLVEDEFKRALDRLGDDQRDVLMLVTLGELSYQETAEALGVPIGTVMSRLFRARRQLQEELAAFARSRGFGGAEA